MNLEVRSWWLLLGQVSAGLCSLWRLRRKFFSWSFSPARGCLHFFICLPFLRLQSQLNSDSNFPSTVTIPSATNVPPALSFKELCDYFGPTWKIQKASYFKDPWLHHLCKVPLAWYSSFLPSLDWTETISGKECSTVPFTTDKCFFRSTRWWCQNSRLNSPSFKARGLNRSLWSLLPSLEEMIKSYRIHHEKCRATCKIITAPLIIIMTVLTTQKFTFLTFMSYFV